MGNIYKETIEIMKKYNITANKSLGQNFLIDEEVIDKIVKEANVTKDDLVIEIGPGLGTLTKPLLENAKRVICIELDQRMVNILNDRFCELDNFEIIHQDVLKEDLKKLIDDNKKKHEIKNAKIVANLPYYITTPIIMKLIEDKLDIQSITVMVQKEVAQRLAAIPGEEYTGAITYTINYYTEPKIIVEVPNDSFIPAPEVDSAVINLKLLKENRVKIENEELFFKIIKVSFMQKRKTLVNALVNGNILNSKKEAQEMIEKLGLDINVRGEKISIYDYSKITDYIDNLRNSN